VGPEPAVSPCTPKKQKQLATQILSQITPIWREKNFTTELRAHFLLHILGASLPKRGYWARQLLIQTHSATPVFAREKYLLTDTFAFAPFFFV